MIYAADTSTSVERTRAELESVIHRYGADTFGYATDSGRACIQFRSHGKFVKFILPLPAPGEKRFTEYRSRGYLHTRAEGPARKEWEQACRSAWRALFLAVKAKLVAVEAKITTFEQEFMAHIVLPDGRTAGEVILPEIEAAYLTGQMPTFTLALPAPAAA